MNDIKHLIVIDSGETCGVAVVDLETKELTDVWSAAPYEVMGIHRMIGLMKLRQVGFLLERRPRWRTNNPVPADIEAYVCGLGFPVFFVAPGQWKGHPSNISKRRSKGTNQHERDAENMASWFISRTLGKEIQ